MASLGRGKSPIARKGKKNAQSIHQGKVWVRVSSKWERKREVTATGKKREKKKKGEDGGGKVF